MARVLLVEDRDGRRGQQEVDHAAIGRARNEAPVVMQHRRHDAGRAVRRRGDDASAGGVLLVHRQRIEVHPVEHDELVAQRGFGVRGELAVQLRRAPLHLVAAGQHAFGGAAATDAVLHHVPDLQQTRIDRRVVAPVSLVDAHHAGDAELLLATQREQLVAAVKRQRQRGRVGGYRRFARLSTRRPRRRSRRRPSRSPSAAAALPVPSKASQAHAVRVQWQAVAPVEDQVVCRIEGQRRGWPGSGNAPFARTASTKAGIAADIDGVRLESGQPQQHRLVAAMSLAGRAERAEQLDAQPRDTRPAAAAIRAPGRNAAAARIGPTVWELDGPMPILNSSKQLTANAWSPSGSRAGARGSLRPGSFSCQSGRVGRAYNRGSIPPDRRGRSHADFRPGHAGPCSHWALLPPPGARRAPRTNRRSRCTARPATWRTRPPAGSPNEKAPTRGAAAPVHAPKRC